MSFENTVERLTKIAWGSAPDWDDRAAAWLQAYYRRLATMWPNERTSLPPSDPSIVSAAFEKRSDEDQARIATAVDQIRAAARERADDIESTSRDLIPVILAWSLGVDAGELSASNDPGEPLLEMFEAGFQIQYRHEGIHLHHQAGWRIYQPPTRASLAS